jgi:hypothetical protein
MSYITRTVVTGTANVEVVASAVAGTVTQPKHVTGVYVTEVTGTLYHNAIIRIYKNTERLVDMALVHLLTDNALDTRYFLPFIPLDVSLAPGDVLSVGHVSGATASNLDFAVAFDVTK